MTYFLSMGSNLGDRRKFLRLGLDQIPFLVAVSSLYRSSPMQMRDEAAEFYNIAVEIECDLKPHLLLEMLHRIEESAGRVRPYPNAPRSLDIDIIYWSGGELSDNDLVIPHPRAHERLFVLAPLYELSPEIALRLDLKGRFDLSATMAITDDDPATGDSYVIRSSDSSWYS